MLTIFKDFPSKTGWCSYLGCCMPQPGTSLENLKRIRGTEHSVRMERNNPMDDTRTRHWNSATYMLTCHRHLAQI